MFVEDPSRNGSLWAQAKDDSRTDLVRPNYDAGVEVLVLLKRLLGKVPRLRNQAVFAWLKPAKFKGAI